PGAWHQMSVMLNAASALRWARELLGLASEEALLERVAALSAQQRATAPLFLPYLSGERTPHNDPHAQGVLFGLAAGHDAASLGYAVIEGVAFGLLDGWESMEAATGEVTQLSLVGGGARSPLWATLIASALGVPLVTHEGGEAGGALGAARLAWLAAGGEFESVCASPPVRDRFEPQAHLSDLLAARHGRFRRLYPALRAEFRS
ncbi:MAG: xylulokinase, partial [Ramlibacter sp.]|nr:xylulokinase [Ramlibacter sp.]